MKNKLFQIYKNLAENLPEMVKLNPCELKLRIQVDVELNHLYFYLIHSGGEIVFEFDPETSNINIDNHVNGECESTLLELTEYEKTSKLISSIIIEEVRIMLEKLDSEKKNIDWVKSKNDDKLFFDKISVQLLKNIDQVLIGNPLKLTLDLVESRNESLITFKTITTKDKLTLETFVLFNTNADKKRFSWFKVVEKQTEFKPFENTKEAEYYDLYDNNSKLTFTENSLDDLVNLITSKMKDYISPLTIKSNNKKNKISK